MNDNPAIVFPEIIGVAIVATYSPFYLWQIFQAGHGAVAALGAVGWAVGVTLTIALLRRKQFVLALAPMVLVLGVGLLIHRFIA